MKLPEWLSKNVVLLGIVSFLTDVSSEMIFPVLPLFLSSVLGVGKEVIGLIEGVADSIAGLTDIVFGYWSDRLGKRKEFAVAGYGLSAVLKGGLLFASAWQHVLLIRGAERLGKSVRTAPRDALIAASTKESQRGRAFGFHRSMDTLGAIAGPAIAFCIFAIMGQNGGAFRTIFLLALVPAALAVLVLALAVREPKSVQAQAAARRPGFWVSLRSLGAGYKRFLSISLLFSLAYFSFALLVLRASEIGLGPDEALLAYLAFNICYALASVPAGMLSDRVGRRPVIAAAFCLYALICVGFIFASDFWQVVALFMIYGAFVATDESVNKAFISDMTDERTRGMALGAYNSAVGAAYLPANAVFGVVWAAFGAGAAFGAAAVVALAAGSLMLLWRR
ncbi:MAG: MFS transporter [Candidatus Micrarchaeota archaeon]